jgi:CubicO group peptidase (beta-lactamase class C family)
MRSFPDVIDLNRRAMLALAGGAGLTSLFPAPLFAKAPAVGLVEEMRAKHGAPALGGMIVTRADVPFLETAGTRRIDTRDRVGRDDQWCIGSNTKAMTAVVYARLVEQGAARWGAKLTELFPDFAAGMREEWKVLTIEHLLSHSAGIIDDNYDPHQWVRDNLGKKKLEELPPARTAQAEPVFTAKPGGPSGKFA